MWAKHAPGTVNSLPFASLLSTRQSNTRDKLRGAHDPMMVLGGNDTVATGLYHAPLRLHPPLVSFIALFGSLRICPVCRMIPLLAARSPAYDDGPENRMPASEER